MTVHRARVEAADAAGAEGNPARPYVPFPVEEVTRAFFRSLSRLRGKRIFHPHGILFSANLRVPHGVAEHRGVALLERPATFPANVRFSRALGLPSGMPDVLGIALRLLDAYGRGQHQDLLLVSSGTAPGLRHALVPGPRGFFGHHFSTLLPYALNGRTRMIGLRPIGRRSVVRDLDPLRGAAPGSVYSLRVAPLAGEWMDVARLEIQDPRPDEEAERLELTPWNTGGGMRPTGPMMGLRRPAYEGSQEGRRDARADGR